MVIYGVKPERINGLKCTSCELAIILNHIVQPRYLFSAGDVALYVSRFNKKIELILENSGVHSISDRIYSLSECVFLNSTGVSNGFDYRGLSVYDVEINKSKLYTELHNCLYCNVGFCFARHSNDYKQNLADCGQDETPEICRKDRFSRIHLFNEKCVWEFLKTNFPNQIKKRINCECTCYADLRDYFIDMNNNSNQSLGKDDN